MRLVSLQSLEIEHARLQERHAENPQGRLFAPLADVLRKIGRLDEALELCRDGLSRHPAYSSAYVILGKIYLGRGDSEAASEAFEKVLELDAENLLALRQIAEIREAEGELRVAEELWMRVASLEPESEAVEDRLEALRHRIEAGTDWEVEDAPEPDPDEEDLEESLEDVPTHVAEDVAEEEVAEDEAAEEEGDDSPEVPTESSPEAPGEPAAPTKASSAEIATITLAQIYREQGFLRKALEVYEQVRERNPQLEGIAERIAEIHAEIQAEPPTPEPTEAALDDLVVPATSAGSATASSASAAREDESGMMREGPITRAVRDQSERERFDGFRRWLDGITDDEEAGSE